MPKGIKIFIDQETKQSEGVIRVTGNSHAEVNLVVEGLQSNL